MAERRKLTYGDSRLSSVRKSRLPVTSSRVSSVTTGRASSATRSTRPLSSEGRSSTAGSSLRRYGSDTHLNTPNYMMTPMGRSPGMRYSAVPDSSRRAKHENAVKVQEILHRDDKFYAELNLQNGLKSMTGKQFMLIINYFIKAITGKDMSVLFGKGDPLDGIVNFLRDIKCPYIINKSMLKSPNAPHTFDQIIVLMLWLCDFIEIPQLMMMDTENASDKNFKRDDELPDREYTAKFSNAMIRGFQLWNSESDEFEILQNQLVDDFIKAKTKSKVASAAELSELTEKLKLKNKDLDNVQFAVPDEQHFQRIKNQFLEYDTRKTQFEMQVKEKVETLNAINVIWQTKHAELKKKRKSLQTIENQIANQCISFDGFRKLSFEISQLRNAVDAIDEEILSLRNEETVLLTNRARLLKKVRDAIPKFNQQMKQIIEIVERTKIVVDQNLLSNLFLEPNSTIGQVEEISKKLASLLTVVNIYKHSTMNSIKKSTDELELLKTMEKNCLKQLQKSEEMHIKVASKKQTLEKKIISEEDKSKNEISIATEKLRSIQADLEELKRNIIDKKQCVQRLENENAMILAESEKKLQEIWEQKEQMIIELTETEALAEDMISRYNLMLDSTETNGF